MYNKITHAHNASILHMFLYVVVIIVVYLPKVLQLIDTQLLKYKHIYS